jgi:Kef-type K+ transport system membrane component KefB
METPTAIHMVLGVLLLTGLLLGLLASRFELPRVAAYVIAGMLFSPSLLGGWLGIRVGDWAQPLTTAALGVIAYLIGGSITVAQLRRTGRMILGSTLGESLGAALVVFLAMLLVLPGHLAGVPAVMLALAFGAIAAPTAPAATIAVLHQYRARGPLSSTLLGVVALDDAVGVILFAVISALSAATSLAAGLGGAVAEIVGSVLLGLGAGVLISRLARHLIRDLRLPLIVAAILLTIGVADRMGISPLLAAMALGFSARAGLGAAGDRLFAPVEYLEELVFLIFFTVAGALFDPRVLASNAWLVVVYYAARVLGKFAGAAIGGRLSGAPPVVCRWLGLALIPQAGVAVGLALALSQYPPFRPVSDIVVNVILGSTLLTAVTGPLAMRLALKRAAEISVDKMKMKRQ